VKKLEIKINVNCDGKTCDKCKLEGYDLKKEFTTFPFSGEIIIKNCSLMKVKMNRREM